MQNNYNISVLISGRGSNLLSLIENSENFVIQSIVSNIAEAPGLQLGEKFTIPCFAFSRRDYSSLSEQKRAIYQQINELSPDLIVLAGFMQILPADFIDKFFGKIVNIHPSLLPLYPGLDTHERVLEAKDSSHGCSVHYVDSGVDTGPVIAQASLKVAPGESLDSLKSRVLALEHRLYPWVINNIALGSISLENRSVKYNEVVRKQAKRLGYTLGSQ